MPTVFVARQLGRPLLVMSSVGTNHRVIPFKDGSALIAWIGDTLTPAILDRIPTGDILLGTNHERAIGVFAKMLRDVLDDADKLRRLSYGIRFSAATEYIVATREGTWRIDHTFQVHACAYACIGNGIHQTESLLGEYINSCRDSDVRFLVTHALHVVGESDPSVNGPYRFPEVDLVSPDPFLLPLQPKLNIRD